MDVLSDVLSAVRLKGAIFFDNTFRPPWVAETPEVSLIGGKVLPHADHVFCFHTLLDGSCWAELTDGSLDPIRLNAGDIVVFPQDARHALCSTPGMRAEQDLAVYRYPRDHELPYIVNQGGGSDTCHFVCGYLGCDTRPFNPFFSSLPRVLHAHGVASGGGWLTSLARQATSESTDGRPGGETILAKLAELMFVEVLRQHVDRLAEDSRGWLSGLKDRHVSHALRLIHGQPENNWTLDSLSRTVGLSRSVFADRFMHYVGISAMQYVGRWRMQLAARRLESSGTSIAQIGTEVGYESEAAFSRAFKRFVGVPPGAWRRRRT
jgi:AraC-like DNA-binding protein